MHAVNARAFTLMELLLVVGLLAILAGFFAPAFSSSGDREQLDESVQRLRSLISMCRASAMGESRAYHLIIRQDGTLTLRRQADPIQAPHIYERVRAGWANQSVLLDGVWVESVVPLPEGPPPVLLDDQVIQYGDREYDYNEIDREMEPILVDELEMPVVIEFVPDGTADSLRWVLRDKFGRGAQMTLDGRLGRVTIEPVEPRDPSDVEPPPDVEDIYDEPDVDWEPVYESPWR